MFSENGFKLFRTHAPNPCTKNYFIEHMIINGIMDESLLYEQPFMDKNELGLDGVFPRLADNLIAIIKKINQSVRPVGV